MIPPLPPDEPARLARLQALNILDTPAEERFDRITRLASALFDVPIVLVSLVDRDRQWFKSRHGLDAPQTPRDISFCGHAIRGKLAFVVSDAAADPRFQDNPLVSGDPKIRFYAGQPLLAQEGSAVGTLCLIDRRPRALTEQQRGALGDLAAIVESELASLELATLTTALTEARARIESLERILPICSYCQEVRDGEDYWQDVQTYLKKHEGVLFSHGICPPCYQQHVQSELEALEKLSEEGSPTSTQDPPSG